MKEKILYVSSDKISLNDIPWGLLELKKDVQIYDPIITLQTYVEEEKSELIKYLSEHQYRIVITYNFSPIVSDACQQMGIKYVSWIFDSPQIDLYTQAYYNSCNYIFVFDKLQKERLEPRGVAHLYHMPLAANVSRVSGLQFADSDFQEYSSEIAFVGNLYEDNVFDRTAHLLPEDIRNKIVDHIRKKSLHWKKRDTVFGCFSDEDCERISNQFYLGEWIDLDKKYFLEIQYIVRKLAQIERVCILNALALEHEVKLYTTSNTAPLENVKIAGKVSYSEEAPKVFHLSKINLNMTLRSIETGVPQRVFDIMSAGGFVMSNYQEELEELFVPDEEIVLFHDMAELVEKVNYYLSHEQERIRIAFNGYKKVKEYYNYPKKLEEILSIVERD